MRQKVVLAVALLLAACTGTDPSVPTDGSTASTPSTVTSTSTGPSTSAGPSSEGYATSGLVPATGPYVEAIADAVRVSHVNNYAYTDASIAFHREVFADGDVTRAEYERAVFAAADCMRELGYTIEGPFPYGPNTGEGFGPGVHPNVYMYYWAINAGPNFDEESTRCQEIWEFTVIWVWLVINQPTEAEIQIWLEAAWACAREKGFPVSDPPTVSEAMNASGGGLCEPWNALPPR